MLVEQAREEYCDFRSRSALARYEVGAQLSVQYGVASECRTSGARIIFPRCPSPPGLGYVQQPALRALTNYQARPSILPK